MPSLDAQIDALYQQPLDQFVSARNALAKALRGDERVRALAKPTVVAWSVNQVYWRARAAYERLMTSGVRLRTAQISALEGKPADVAGAGAAHRQAIADAVLQAQALAAEAGAAPDADALMRTFEALSLAATTPAPPGRLAGAMQPAGFEALAGVKPAVASSPRPTGSSRHATGSGRPALARSRGRQPDLTAPAGSDAAIRLPVSARASERPSAAELKRERDAEIVRQAAMARQAEIAKAEAALATVEAEEQRARDAWERAHDALLAARRALFSLKSSSRGPKPDA